jgi:hypothetical protein
MPVSLYLLISNKLIPECMTIFKILLQDSSQFHDLAKILIIDIKIGIVLF